MFAFLTRMKNGLIMAGISTRYMFQRPKLLFFPLLRVVLFSSIYSLLFLLLFYFFSFIHEYREIFSKTWAYPVFVTMFFIWIFLCVYLFFFIMLFSSVATIDYLWDLFQGKTPSIRSSLGIACKRIPTILLWSGVHSGVRFLIGLFGGGEDSSSLRKMAAGATDVAWRVSTYFVVPIITEKRISFIETLKESYQLMKQRFGEVVGVAVSFNLLANIIFPGIVWIVATIMNYLYDSGQGKRMAIDFYKYPHAYTILIVVFLVTLIFRVFITTAQDIFKAAAFSYAHDKSTGPFAPELIDESFETK